MSLSEIKKVKNQYACFQGKCGALEWDDWASKAPKFMGLGNNHDVAGWIVSHKLWRGLGLYRHNHAPIGDWVLLSTHSLALT